MTRPLSFFGYQLHHQKVMMKAEILVSKVELSGGPDHSLSCTLTNLMLGLGATSSTFDFIIVDGPDFNKSCADSTVTMARYSAHTGIQAQSLFFHKTSILQPV